MDVATIRTALKAKIGTISGLNVDDLRENPQVPCAIVYPDVPLEFDRTFDHANTPHFVVLVLVQYTDTDNAQDQLDAYISTTGTTSIKAAVEADETLGGAVSSAVVTELKSYAVIQMADSGPKYLSAELAVEVWA